MFKQGIKNYFRGLKHFFTPLGTMFLGVLIGFSILLPGIMNAISSLVDGIKQLVENVNLDIAVLGENLWEAVRSLNWDSPFEAFKTVLSVEWINHVLTEALNTLLGVDFETFKAQIAVLIGEFTSSVSMNVGFFVSFWVLGFMAGYVLLKFSIRRNIAKRSIWKALLSSILNSIVSAIYVVFSTWLFMIWQNSVYINLLFLLLFVGVFTLIQAYFLYGYKKVKFKKVVSVKNVAQYMLSGLLILVITICLTLIALAINKLMGVFVGLSLLLIALLVISMNAESYVQSYVKTDENKSADCASSKNTADDENELCNDIALSEENAPDADKADQSLQGDGIELIPEVAGECCGSSQNADNNENGSVGSKTDNNCPEEKHVASETDLSLSDPTHLDDSN